MSTTGGATEFTLPEQRSRVRVVAGGRGATHVLIEQTFRAATAPGHWTRKAWSRRALCGSLCATVIGGDAIDWDPINLAAVDANSVSCKRCVERHSRMTEVVS